MKNPRDIHGDGHGFVDVPIGRPNLAKREYRFNYDLTKLPTHNKPFLGLYHVGNGFEPVILLRAKPHRGLNFVSFTNHHYMGDPIAWAELPSYE